MDFENMKKDKDFQEWCFETELVGNKEWFNLENGSGDEVYIAYEAWVYGQQRKQAQIDKIKQLLKQWEDWISVSDGNNHIDIVKECANELREILK